MAVSIKSPPRRGVGKGKLKVKGKPNRLAIEDGSPDAEEKVKETEEENKAKTQSMVRKAMTTVHKAKCKLEETLDKVKGPKP